jgi:putative drug exporter of the RND superfamily
LRRVSALASFVSGRRTKWVVIALWIAAVVALAPLGAKLGDVTRDETASFLPAEAESTKVQELLKDRFPGGETGIGLIVYRRKGGLTEADQARIARDARAVDEAIPVSRPAQVPFGPDATPGLVSERGDAAYTVITVPLDFDKAADWGNETRDLVRPSQGLETFVTGDLGLFADFDEVFGEVDTRLLLATVALVLILLGLIYRAPLIAIVPIVVVALSYQIASGFIYLYADAGNSVNSNATSILVVLMFGVGTDYCLLLVSRYREELHRVQDKHEAMARALRRAGPAVLASGCTVVTAMLVLLLAESGSTNALGPVSAIGVACVLLAGLTLLPALLTIFGRRGFWPRKRVVAYNPDVDVEERCGLRRRFGDRVLQRPAAALAATTALFAFFALGLLSYKEDYSIGGFFKTSVESVDGFNVLGQSFPQGALGPTTILVQREGGRVTDADVAAAQERLQGVDAVASVGEPVRSEDGAIARFDVTFSDDPYSDAALARVDTLRDRLRDLPGGATALVGAGSAVQQDLNVAAERDLRVIVPVALLVIAVILGVLLQAIVAPIVLIATVMASFLGTLGLSIFFFIEIQGSRGVDASLPTFAFIFLVALGVDYTIFLMSRVREEGPHPRDARGRPACAGRHRSGDHQRRRHPRRHLRGADDAAGDLRLQHRLHGRRRDPARHVRGPNDHGPRRGRAPRRSRLVAVHRPRRRPRAARARGGARRRDGVTARQDSGAWTCTRSASSWKSPTLWVTSGTRATFAVAAIARSIALRRGRPPRAVTAAASRPHSRATAASSGSGSNVASMTPTRKPRRALSSGSGATSTPKCSSASETALIAPSRSPGDREPIRTDVSRSARTTRTDRRARRGTSQGHRRAPPERVSPTPEQGPIRSPSGDAA